MRTTITIDDRLLEALKKRAAETGSTVSRLIEGAVRLVLKGGGSEEPTGFELVTFGEGGEFTSQNVDKAWVVMEQEDVERYGGGER